MPRPPPPPAPPPSIQTGGVLDTDCWLYSRTVQACLYPEEHPQLQPVARFEAAVALRHRLPAR